ncbi:MAG TPA: PilT/PilU family type 4a pilus ATPase [Verrucomicrobiae bacterium]|nr:PilT/PilU family type 4a pilus ATPase [Verrucomicrobiae bacterium]
MPADPAVPPDMGTTILRELLSIARQRGASDLHLMADAAPLLRIQGELVALAEGGPIADPSAILLPALAEQQRQRLFNERELDFAISVTGAGRFRGNAHWQRGHIEVAFRRIEDCIPSLAELGLPPIAERLCRLRNGLVLITGPAGSGKSTTAAAMIEHINASRRCVIITIEDPVEFVHANRLAAIKQREVGSDTPSFASGLTRILRQDPDVIFVGEMRDLDSISWGLRAAETGHLVISTLHTADAAQTVNRIVSIFPPEKRPEILTQLAYCIEAVISQQLIPSKQGGRRTLACEVMIANPAIRTCIRDHLPHQIASHIQLGAREGMQTMDTSLVTLARKGLITRDEAAARMKEPSLLDGPA